MNDIKKLKERVTGTQSVWKPRLDAYLYSLNFKEEEDGLGRTYNTGLHPSQISGCTRKAVYSRLGTDSLVYGKGVGKIDAKLRRIFDNGSGVHERLQKYFRDMGVLLGRWYCRSCKSIVPEREIEETYPENKGKVYSSVEGTGWVYYHDKEDYDLKMVLIPKPKKCPHCGQEDWVYAEVPIHYPKMDIRGHTDGIAYSGEEDINKVSEEIRKGNFSQYIEDLWILEFKSENSFKFSKSTSPHQSHIMQASIYAFCTQMGIRNVSILYESKNDQEIKEYTLRLGKEDILKVLEKIKKIQRCEKEEILPERESSPACNYCEYAQVCVSSMSFKDIRRYIEAKIPVFTDSITLDTGKELVEISLCDLGI